MRQCRLWNKSIIRLSFLTVVIILLVTVPLLVTNANTAKSASEVILHLVDENGIALTNVKLTARYVSSNKVCQRGETNNAGIIQTHLPSGKYYFTGDISALNSRMPYFINIKGNDKMMFYYISEPVEITGDAKVLFLAVNSGDYVDVGDIAGDKNFMLYVYQDALGINTFINVHSSANGVRLFLPMRKNYYFANQSNVLSLKWPVYATPGLRFVFSAS